MPLNPIAFTESVVRDFLRYQLTAFRFADPGLRGQMRTLLSLDHTRRSPLLRGPYVSLSRSFRDGASIEGLVKEGLLHSGMRDVAFPRLYGHQEKALRSILGGKTTLVSTGTGSGKTECFLYPVIQRCLEQRDRAEPPGIRAVFVYPMNALAEDQLLRLREMLAGTGIPFGMYIGKTPERKADVAGKRLAPGASRADFRKELERARKSGHKHTIHPAEERVSREEMRAAGGPPRILLTNVKQLELLLTRHKDVELFEGVRLEFLVFDEAHTYGGAQGAETACLVRRLRSFCGSEAAKTVCVGTSATLAAPGGGDAAAKQFASRFFGVPAPEVAVITEEYQGEDWKKERYLPGPPPRDSAEHLREVLAAVEVEDASARAKAVAQAWSEFRPQARKLEEAHWQEQLHTDLAANELCFRMARSLEKPKAVDLLVAELSKEMGRDVREEELLSWLALGAASRKDERPLLRPVLHGFVRGLDGAVIDFPEDTALAPRLWLSAEEQVAKVGDDAPYRLPIMTCTTCGQHYFVHHVADLELGPKGPGGGQAAGDRAFWKPLDRSLDGVRVVLLDHLVGAEEDDDDPARTHAMFLCRWCGALHPKGLDACDSCGRQGPLVQLLAVEPKDPKQGGISSCLSCRSPGAWRGGGLREPAKAVRAVAVADVHVLAQNMIQEAERKRLLVFTDNRQEAAFQAGWMRDHARRFRLRALMYEKLRAGLISVGDLVAHLDQLLDRDEALSRALLTEVWEVERKAASGVEHQRQRKKYLRIQVLLEVTQSKKQRVGLEPWGRMRVDYLDLAASDPFIRSWATKLGFAPDRFFDGVATLVDFHRRERLVLDQVHGIFSQIWHEGLQEVQRNYLPLLRGVPKALKLVREPQDSDRWIKPWVTSRGATLVRRAAVRMGVPADEIETFLRELWSYLVEKKLLAPAVLRGQNGNPLPDCAGGYQIDGDRLILTPHQGRWRCDQCQRVQSRPSPGDLCLHWNCSGTLAHEVEDPDDYDLTMLDRAPTMLLAAEHSAQVPADERERIETLFKGDGDAVNTLVCTPTLELGVDIGGLDSVLLRNVPPAPANYWQRVGRAGRRHRLAVNLTYARTTSHDRAYFAAPEKLLGGRVEPPRFNLRNELMVRKHVHASALTRLHQLAHAGSALTDTERAEIGDVLRRILPVFVKDYLFDPSGELRSRALDVSELGKLVAKYRKDLTDYVQGVFGRSWPAEDKAYVDHQLLEGCLDQMAQRLDEVVGALWDRLEWHIEQMRRLDKRRVQQGTLDAAEDAQYRRCDRFVKRMKGVFAATRGDAEGQDDTYTFGVLAAEGFLPGYGLDTGSILGQAEIPPSIGPQREFSLPRPPAVAAREYVPGNLLYANGHRFVARRFHLRPEDPLLFQVDTASESISLAGSAQPAAVGALGASALKGVPICDVDLVHRAHISDEEDFRFQMPVAVYAQEQGRHGVGVAFRWGTKQLIQRKSVHMRLVNVGPARKVEQGELGYPLCLADGDSRSPLASPAELQNFEETKQKFGLRTDRVGFYADVVVDALLLQDLDGREEGWSVLEALRMGMSQVLDMEIDDLQIQVLGRAGSQQVDGLLYDPMPGGSGLLEQALERFGEVHAAAMKIVRGCAGQCERSCIDCLQTFRNSFYHAHLDRHAAVELLERLGHAIERGHEIAAKLPQAPATGKEMPVNAAEARLKLLLERAQLPTGIWHETLRLGHPLGSTSPDVFYELDDLCPGVCIYLDGLSRHVHGNSETAERDRLIRTELRTKGYEVIEIPATHLHDPDSMRRYFMRLADRLSGREAARRIRDDGAWFLPP